MKRDLLQTLGSPKAQALLWLFAAAVAARLPVLLTAHGADYDIESYQRVARTLTEGGRLYGDPQLSGRYPYFPAWALSLWALGSVADALKLNALWIFKLPALGADLGVTALLFMISSRLVFSNASSSQHSSLWLGRPFWAAMAWAVNPVVLLISAGHGQFDSVALCFILLAAWYLEFSEHPRSDFASAISLGFAIAFKTWPIFFLPLFIKGFSSAQERLRYSAVALALPALLLLPFAFMCGWEETWKALAYTGSQAFSLPEALRGFFYGAQASPAAYLATAQAWRVVGMASLGFLWLLYTLGPWRFPLFGGLAFATLTLYVFAPGLAAQYLCWLLPFALLVPGRLALRHSLVSLTALLLFYSLFAPEAFLRGGDWSMAQPQPWFFLVWAFLNLGLWLYFVREWISIGRLCRRPSGRLNFA